MTATRIDKLPVCCADPSEFQIGDILIFNDNGRTKINIPTVSGQSLLNNRGGHRETVHVGVVVKINSKVQIAHLRSQGFTLSDIDTIKTTTHIYRPKIYQTEIGEKLSQLFEESQDQFKRNIHWRVMATVYALAHRMAADLGIENTDPESKSIKDVSTLPKPEQVLSSWSICSKFLSESYVASCYNLSKEDKEHKDYRKSLMNIETNTVPKTLQSYLYRCSNYQYLLMTQQETRGELV